MRKEITMKEYNKKMEEVTKKGLSVPDTLIAMLDEASKYTIKGFKEKKNGKKV